jgi:hypothetical protein
MPARRMGCLIPRRVVRGVVRGPVGAIVKDWGEVGVYNDSCIKERKFSYVLGKRENNL